ncbi:cytochrome P450 [Nocardia panacis]|nr:cytochrome P450 [Nocardia panacis]
MSLVPVMAPERVPLLGHVRPFRRDPLGLFESLRAYGEVVRIRIGWQQVYVVTSTEATVELFTTKSRQFDKGVTVEYFRDVFGYGLLSSEGETHRLHRLLLQPAFRRERLAGYVAMMRDRVGERIAQWRPGQVLDAREALTAITIDIIAGALISASVGKELAEEVQSRLPRVLELSYGRAMNPFPVLNRLPLARNREWAEHVARLHPMIDRVIADYRGADHDDATDLLGMMLAARDTDSGATMSDAEIHDQLLTILLAGSETTATALSWLFVLLTQHPRVAEKLVAELDRVLAGRPLEYDDLPRLPYTARVIDEALRHSPPIWLITRRALQPVELGGLRVPKGASIMLSPYLTGHDPKLLANPERFDPDRWAGERMGQTLRRAALPFGAGPRKCIGDTFATLELTVVLTTILARLRVGVAPGTDFTPETGMTYYPSGLRLRVDPRGESDYPGA